MDGNRESVVVVGVDGSADSLGAVGWAATYAAATGAGLRLVTSWQWPLSYGAPVLFDGYDPAADAQRVIETAAAGVPGNPPGVEKLVVEGSPGPALVAAAQDAAALIVGSRGHGAVSGLLLGSVSAYCVQHATCPVVVVR